MLSFRKRLRQCVSRQALHPLLAAPLAAMVMVLSGWFTCRPALSEISPRVIHVFVTLCDNTHQQIVPVPPQLGNGEDPGANLYWGALYGVKTYFGKSGNWLLLETIQTPSPAPKPARWDWLPVKTTAVKAVLERCVFQHMRQPHTFLVADAYQGSRIEQSITDFLKAASGKRKASIELKSTAHPDKLPLHGGADLVAYVGHNGLMDFQLQRYPRKKDGRRRDAIVLACRSKQYFSDPIRLSGANPLLWTNGLMAPEAYTLEEALEGWVRQESAASIRLRAAEAYHRYQKCGLPAAKRLFATGFDPPGS
jgi:hypothetical protein